MCEASVFCLVRILFCCVHSSEKFLLYIDWEKRVCVCRRRRIGIELGKTATKYVGEWRRGTRYTQGEEKLRLRTGGECGGTDDCVRRVDGAGVQERRRGARPTAVSRRWPIVEEIGKR